MVSTRQSGLIPNDTHVPDKCKPHDIKVDIRYTKQGSDGTPITIEGIHGDDERLREVRHLLVKDVRRNPSDFTLEKNGFEYIHHEVPQEHFADDATIRAQHYPEIEAFLIQTYGAKMVLIYNHIVRNAPWTTDISGINSYVGPAHRCHIDVSTTFGKEVAELQLKGHNKEDLIPSVMAGRWQLLNLWRPLKTVQKNPLAVGDSSTIPYSDQRPLSYERTYEMNGEEKKSKVETLFTLASKHDTHQFYYMNKQQPNELLVFKTADSDGSATGAVTHTSFDVPGTEDLPTRESIEIRVLVAY